MITASGAKMTTLLKNQYKLLVLACVIWQPVIVLLSPALNTVVFVFIILLAIWFGKGSVEVSYYYKANFDKEHVSWAQLFIAALLVPFWIWCLNFRKPY